MAETARIKSLTQNWRAWGLVISGLNRQKILKLSWWVMIEVDYRVVKVFLNFCNLVRLFTVQNRLELGPQIPTEFFCSTLHF